MITAVRHSTRIRIEEQSRRWPNPPAAVAEVRRQLLAWSAGERDDISQIRKDAYAADYAYATAPTASAAAAAAAAYASTYDAASDAATACAIIRRLLDGAA